MRFYYLPSILYFGMPMGLIGAGLNGHHLQEMFALKYDVAVWLLFYGWFSFGVVSLHYIKHLFGRARASLHHEWHDPFKRSFFPAITLTLMLFLLSLKPYFEALSINQAWLIDIYYVIVVFHSFLNIQTINLWLFKEDVGLQQHKPTWFILLSGNFMVVISGHQLLDLSAMPIWHEILWLFFSVGLFLWFTFSASLFYRLFFEQPLNKALRPSLFIFLAPPSLGTIASLALMPPNLDDGSVSLPLITWVLYSFATTMLLIWSVLTRFFIQGGTSMAGWSYVYPLAAYGLATQYLAEALSTIELLYISVGIFIIVLLFISLLSSWLIRQSLKA